MPAQAPPPGVQLPPGWTYHELNGRAFFYHAATNVTRQDIPSMVANDMPPMYPVALAPQMPSPQMQEQAQPQVEPEPPQPQAVYQALAAPQAVSYSVATPPSSPRQAQQMLAQPLMTSPQLVEEDRRIDPMLAGQSVTFGEFVHAHDGTGTGFDSAQLAAIWAQLYPSVQAQPQPPPATSHQQPQLISPQPTQAIVAAQPVLSPATTQPMAQLRVFVPEPGLRAGQQLAFTAPDAGPGSQPLRMMVTVNEQVMPGSIVTVQYPRPHAPQVQSVGQNLPQPAAQVSAGEDERQSTLLWLLYRLGFLCLCFMPLASIALWLAAACIYYCKPEHDRAQYRRARIPAKAAAITCLIGTVLGIIVCLANLVMVDFPGVLLPGGRPHGHHGQWHPGQPDIPHKGPCSLEKRFQGNFRGSHHDGDRWYENIHKYVEDTQIEEEKKSYNKKIHKYVEEREIEEEKKSYKAEEEGDESGSAWSEENGEARGGNGGEVFNRMREEDKEENGEAEEEDDEKEVLDDDGDAEEGDDGKEEEKDEEDDDESDQCAKCNRAFEQRPRPRWTTAYAKACEACKSELIQGLQK